MKQLLVALAVLAAGPAWAGKKPEPPPPLTQEHTHPSGGFTFRTPEGWEVQTSATNPDFIQVGGDGVFLRFLFQRSEVGYDGLHATCMLERLAAPMETAAEVKYEYDFVGGKFGDRRGLDSAFVVTYDKPVFGHKEWRQRNLTLVGAGQSFCAITYAPLDLWKKVPRVRAVLEGVLNSVTFR